MPRRLEKSPFAPQDIDLFQTFSCSDELWEREVSDFIQGKSNGVLLDLERGNQVWYYYTREEGIVGFASLGESKWRWPLPGDSAVPLNLISMLGIDRRFWGQPEGPAEDRFSAQILDDVIIEARSPALRKPLLGLFVHIDNHRAKRLYQRAGFTEFHKRY